MCGGIFRVLVFTLELMLDWHWIFLVFPGKPSSSPLNYVAIGWLLSKYLATQSNIKHYFPFIFLVYCPLLNWFGPGYVNFLHFILIVWPSTLITVNPERAQGSTIKYEEYSSASKPSWWVNSGFAFYLFITFLIHQ